MQPSKKPSAIKPLLFVLAMAWGTLACAAPVGTVVNVSGALLVQKADGSKKILAQNSAVESGDTLITPKGGYAQVRFIDDSRMIFQPGTTLTISRFTYDVDKKENDHADFALVEGGVRINAGAMGKRSQDSVTVTTPTGKLDMHDASAVVQFVAQSMQQTIAAARAFIMASVAALDDSLQSTRTDAPAVMAVQPLMLAQLTPPALPSAGKAPGLYVQVLDGLIHVSNPAGTANFAAGQFGYTPSVTQPPVIVPTNPGIQFTPPPVFNVTSTSQASTAAKPAAVDCVVR